MSTTKVKKLTNGYSYKYSELSTIHDELERQNITYSQEINYNAEAGADYIWTTLTIDGEKEDSKCGCRVITGKLSGGNPAQEQGSALTYARRYSLLMALGWATEDDDAASVGGGHQQPAQQQPHSSDGRLDFEKVKSYLKTLTTVEEVQAAKARTFEKYPKISDKQKNALNRIFADREDQISEVLPSNWHDGDIVPTKEEMDQIN